MSRRARVFPPGRPETRRVTPHLGLGLLSALVDDFDVIVEYRGNDRDHVSLDDPGAHILRTSHPDVEDALEREIPLPHFHHVLAPAILQYAHQPFDAAIDGENVPDSSGGCGEVRQMVQRVDERQGGCAIEGATVVQGGRDAHRRLVGARYAEIHFSHRALEDARVRVVARSAGGVADEELG